MSTKTQGEFRPTFLILTTAEQTLSQCLSAVEAHPQKREILVNLHLALFAIRDCYQHLSQDQETDIPTPEPEQPTDSPWDFPEARFVKLGNEVATLAELAAAAMHTYEAIGSSLAAYRRLGDTRLPKLLKDSNSVGETFFDLHLLSCEMAACLDTLAELVCLGPLIRRGHDPEDYNPESKSWR